MLTYVNEYRMAQSICILYGDSRTWLDSITKAQVRNYSHIPVYIAVLTSFNNI